MNKEDYLYILDLIPTGSDDPVPLGELAYFTGLEERAVKRLIQQVRLAGHPVISHPKGGYFMPDKDDKEDMRIASRFVGMMKMQAYSRIKVAEILSDSIADLELGQVSFDE